MNVLVLYKISSDINSENINNGIVLYVCISFLHYQSQFLSEQNNSVASPSVTLRSFHADIYKINLLLAKVY